MLTTKVVSGALALTTAVMLATAPAQAQRWHHRGGPYYYHHHDRNWGGAAAAGIAGLAAGAIIGGALSQPRYAPGYAPGYAGYAAGPTPNEVAYCQSKFKSYDPASGTYLGYDGVRHPCP